jgi:hypothetical protein
MAWCQEDKHPMPFYRSTHRRILLAAKGRFEFDHFLDVLERRAFRVAMLVVLFLWLCEKIHDTAFRRS